MVENLQQQDFQPPASNRCRAGDITYIRTSSAGWRYLAVWIDLFSRRVVGWKLDGRMDATLVIEAFNRALWHRQVAPETLLLHADQGSQYGETDYRSLLRQRKLSCSMPAKGCCWGDSGKPSQFAGQWPCDRRPGSG
jgi:putative transposase